MSLMIRPHTVTVLQASENVDNQITESIDHESGQTIKGQITPEKASSVFDLWGKELSRPHLFLTNPGDILKVGDRIQYGSRKFRVEATQTWDAETLTECAAMMLEELTVQEE